MNTKSTFVIYLWLLGLIASAMVAISPTIAPDQKKWFL